MRRFKKIAFQMPNMSNAWKATKPYLQSAGGGAVLGAVPGAIAGGISADSGDTMGGMARGALGGAAAGSLGGLAVGRIGKPGVQRFAEANPELAKAFKANPEAVYQNFTKNPELMRSAWESAKQTGLAQRIGVGMGVGTGAALTGGYLAGRSSPQQPVQKVASYNVTAAAQMAGRLLAKTAAFAVPKVPVAKSGYLHALEDVTEPLNLGLIGYGTYKSLTGDNSPETQHKAHMLDAIGLAGLATPYAARTLNRISGNRVGNLAATGWNKVVNSQPMQALEKRILPAGANALEAAH